MTRPGDWLSAAARQPMARQIAFVVCAALVIRLVNLLALGGDSGLALTDDARMYWNTARRTLELGGFYRVDADGLLKPEIERMPLYPMLVAGVIALFGETVWPTLVLQAGLDAATCVLILLIGRRLSPAVGLVAGLAAAASPTLFVNAGLILTETLYLLLLTGGLLALLRHAEHGRLRDVALAGLLIGFALCTRSSIQYLVPVLIAMILALGLRRDRRFLAACTAGLVFAAATLAPVSPILMRNLHSFNSLQLTTQAGNHLMFWVAPAVMAESGYRDRATAIAELRERYDAAALQDPPQNGFEQSALRSRIAGEAMWQAGPAAIVKAWVTGSAINLAAPALLTDPRVRALSNQGFYATEGGVLARVLGFVQQQDSLLYLVIFAGSAILALSFAGLGLVGLALIAWRRPLLALAGVLVAGYFFGVTGPVVSPKYRAPAEPILILWFAIAAVRLCAGPTLAGLSGSAARR